MVEECSKYIIQIFVTEPHLRYLLAAIECGDLAANRCKQRGNGLLISLDTPPVSPWLHHMGCSNVNFAKRGQQYRYIIIQHNHVASVYQLHEYVPYRYASPPNLNYADIAKKCGWSFAFGPTPPVTPASTTPSTIERNIDWTPDHTTSEHHSDIELEELPDPPLPPDESVDMSDVE